MAGIASFFNWKVALIYHTICYSLALLQEIPQLGMLWLIINTFVFLLLLRAVYGPPEDKQSNRGMAWYFYVLSIPTDILSLSVNGSYILHEKQFMAAFVVVMAVFMLIPKPFFAYFLLKSLQNEGFDVKQGFNLRKGTMANDGAQGQYQGFAELDRQTFADQGYSGPAAPPQQQQQGQPDLVIVPNAPPQQQGNTNPGANNINESLMDNVAQQHDVFVPGGQ
mmetsp:Transcript_62016/g.98721  ORF Transcript_62016/g.98721 Transcript_62016/m.98721 type:complete len:222 (+) Transcript_62016:82-747(+)|eukprot:CAMPEP_0197022058 /NCGR_PEP_ID=MMETSP1384-20130603/2968_1 /TAXON_ID=29189 /ORGANISM="Ammonia sp." /LENGTH=221 /DNA_ID=CAMNT_0042450023 /DNA_START=87 /DNA_END=752 /DNA_ORIENTATION=-